VTLAHTGTVNAVRTALAAGMSTWTRAAASRLPSHDGYAANITFATHPSKFPRRSISSSLANLVCRVAIEGAAAPPEIGRRNRLPV
jgi:hypothetical protein